MDRVHINFYQHSPRVEVFLYWDMHTVPVVGDIILLNKNELSKISKLTLLHLFVGLKFRVIERTYGGDWVRPRLEKIWTLKVELADDTLQDISKRIKEEKEFNLQQKTT